MGEPLADACTLDAIDIPGVWSGMVFLTGAGGGCPVPQIMTQVLPTR